MRSSDVKKLCPTRKKNGQFFFFPFLPTCRKTWIFLFKKWIKTMKFVYFLFLAPIRRFLSVCLSVCLCNYSDWIIIHISASNAVSPIVHVTCADHKVGSLPKSNCIFLSFPPMWARQKILFFIFFLRRGPKDPCWSLSTKQYTECGLILENLYCNLLIIMPTQMLLEYHYLFMISRVIKY